MFSTFVWEAKTQFDEDEIRIYESVLWFLQIVYRKTLGKSHLYQSMLVLWYLDNVEFDDQCAELLSQCEMSALERFHLIVCKMS